MPDNSYRDDQQTQLNICLAEIIRCCSDTVQAASQDEFENAVRKCSRFINRVSYLKGFGTDTPGIYPLSTATNADRDNSRLAEIVDPNDRRAPTSFLITGDSDLSLYEVMKSELKYSIRANLISAFITRRMVNLLVDPFNEFIARGGTLRLLTSVMNDFNNPQDLLHVEKVVPGINLRVYYPTDNLNSADFTIPPPPFHIKCYLFEKPDGRHSLIIGSSNLTESGFRKNCEWNYFSELEINGIFSGYQSAFEKGSTQFEKYWTMESTGLTDSFLTGYTARWQAAELDRMLKASAARAREKTALAPRSSQLEALSNLKIKRSMGVKRTSVIAATGLGKTYLAAFDFAESGMKNILFLAHRETIVSKARETFRSALHDESFGFMLTGATGSNELAGITGSESSLFAMVPGMVAKSKYRRFRRDHFDYMVIDEFHHSAAGSYQKLLDWFQPKFLLGLTATPERMDGRDVLANCDYDVAYEIRLFDAIDKQWLVPFQYFAIFDPTDYKSLRWAGLGYDEADLDEALINDTRAELIIKNLNKFLPSTGKIKALAFCASRAHARYMNRRFNEAGIQSVCLLGDDSDEERKTAMRDLQDDEHPLKIICSVDILGEGVDVPAVSHVLLLRPTMSFTVFVQQIGRGLRLAPQKEFVVCLDFVGNFKNSYVARLFLGGFNNLDEYRQSHREDREFKPPHGCYISADTEVMKVWDEELRRVLKPVNRKEALRFIYEEMRSGLEHSPGIMDFFANPTAHDPYVFIKEFDGWLRAKQHFGDMSPYEKELLGTAGEAFLLHLERDLHPTKSYKMVTLTCLLETGPDRYEWPIDEIAMAFKKYYLDNGPYFHDYTELASHDDPPNFPLSRVVSQLIRMPLNYLSNKKTDFFLLERQNNSFSLKQSVRPYWSQPEFRLMLKDRITFALKRYFYRNAHLKQ